MNEVTKVSNDIKTKLWIEKIQSCKTSGMTVRKWCKENKICEQTYYKWLKKLKTIAIENNLVEVPRFIPVPVIPHSYASPESVAHVIKEKYVNGVPLYRQEQEWKRFRSMGRS